MRTIERHPAGQQLPSAALLRAALRTSDRRQEGKPVIGCAALCMFRPDPEAKSASILRTGSAQIGVHPATIDGQRDGKKDGLEGNENARQDKRIVSAVSVFAADSGTCSADMEAEGHTNIRRQGKRNQGALFVSPCHALTWRNL